MTEPAEQRPVALVTGAAGGLGSAICHELGRRGYSLVACDREEEALDALGQALAHDETPVATRAFDLASSDECERHLTWVEQELGHLDVLVNNAAAWFYEPFMDSTDEHWRRVLEVNVIAPARLVRLALPLLRRSSRPRIVNIGSKNGFLGEPRLASYDVSKAALSALTRALALELADDGILVNCLAPGVARTSSNDAELERAGDAYVRRIPLGRLAEPAEIAQFVAFLCSSECSFATGSTLVCDGGQLAGERL
jgi:3-oxoacyl-[acyl-carrier protein] reductase